MQNRLRFPVLCCLFSCAMMFSFTDAILLFAQNIGSGRGPMSGMSNPIRAGEALTGGGGGGQSARSGGGRGGVFINPNGVMLRFTALDNTVTFTKENKRL